jgi:sugar lactone lactonase YvrE
MILTAVCACVALGAASGPAEFTRKPTATRVGGHVRIEFAVNRATDVEAAVLDAQGAVVRHLEAGLLGPNAPAPLTPDSLDQSILWDGKDDAGKPVGGPVRIRVRAGLRPTLDGFVGHDANTSTGALVGLAVNDRGEVFVLDADARMKVFDRRGRYLRTIMPYSASTPKEQLESVGQLTVDGQRLPIVYNAHTGNANSDAAGAVYPLTTGLVKQDLALSPRGHILMASALGTYVHHGLPRYLLALSPTGGAPPGRNFVGPKIREPNNFLGGAGERGVPWFDHLAVSPDGEWIYFNQAGDSARFKRVHGVHRLKWSDGQLGEPFVGQSDPGGDDAHFNDPQGLAVDQAGRLYVCDRLNNRVVVFSSAGQREGQFAVDAPEQIAVHPSGGAMYVVSRAKAPKQRPAAESMLRKFSPWGRGAPKELASLPLKTIELIALDAAAPGGAIVWTVVSRGWAIPHDLVPITEKDGAFQVGASIVTRAGLEHPTALVADPLRKRLIVREREHVFLRREFVEVDLATGKKRPFVLDSPLKGGPLGPLIALDRDGNLYVGADYNKEGIDRFDPAGKPLAFPGLGTSHAEWGTRSPHWSRGLAVGPDGRIYILRITERHIAAQVDVFGPDGKLLKAGLIQGVDRGACGLGVDAAGNIYLGVNIKRKEQPYPADFMDQVPAKPWWFWVRGRPTLWGDRPAPWTYTYYNPYLYHWGSVVKFGPTGGAFYGLRPTPRPPAKPTTAPAEIDPFTAVKNAPADAPTYSTALFEREVKVVGAQWVRHGYGLVPSQDCIWGDPGCACATSDFAVDAFGRVFHPNVFRFCVEALDAAGNHIARIGAYGNADDGAARAAARSGEVAPIPFAWPGFVACADDRLYVADSLNQRVVIVRLGYDTEATCEAQ